MLNIDKYRSGIVEAIKEFPVPVEDAICIVVDKDSYGDALNWLFSEYEPPLLENGYGLKPGDWIMVRGYVVDKWVKRQFAYYFEGVFYCAAFSTDPSSNVIVGWEQARLPEEGD